VFGASKPKLFTSEIFEALETPEPTARCKERGVTGSPRSPERPWNWKWQIMALK